MWVTIIYFSVEKDNFHVLPLDNTENCSSITNSGIIRSARLYFFFIIANNGTVNLTFSSNTKSSFSICLVEMTQKQISKLSLITIVDKYRKTLAASWQTNRSQTFFITPDLVTRQKGSVYCTIEDSQTFILSLYEMKTNNVKIGYLAHKLDQNRKYHFDHAI